VTDKLGDAAVTSAKLANDSVLAEKIARDAVTTDKIAGDAVTATKLAPDSVTTGKLIDGAVTSPKLGGGAVTAPTFGNATFTLGPFVDAPVGTSSSTFDCPAGRRMLSGGLLNTGANGDLVLIGSHPNTSSQWRVQVKNTAVAPISYRIVVHCLLP
jgi:hypothetical protein